MSEHIPNRNRNGNQQSSWLTAQPRPQVRLGNQQYCRMSAWVTSSIYIDIDAIVGVLKRDTAKFALDLNIFV